MGVVPTLLVEDDTQIAWGISRAIEAQGFQRPHQVTNARDAIAWVTHNECGLCFLAYKLPDMTGVDLTLRLRQRKPELPIYMLSSAGSESVAVAAFRAGVSDYFIKDAHVYDAAARIVRQISTAEKTLITHSGNDSIPEGMPRELSNPTYQNRLRAVGRQLDINRYRIASIFEVKGGFLVRAIPENGRTAEALEFPHSDFLHWIADGYRNRGSGERKASTSPLLTSGYEDFLRALGAELDRHAAESITITELVSVVAVGGNARLATSAQAVVGNLQNLQWILQSDAIQELLDEDYKLRSKSGGPQGQPSSVLNRIKHRRPSS